MIHGLIHIYYGNGKGKTTAAIGLALRAAGSGKRVVIVQYLKGRICGELSSLALLPGVTLMRGKSGNVFVRNMSDVQKAATREMHDENLKCALALVRDGLCDLLVLDEALDAYRLGLVDEALLTALIQNKPAGLELVVTGHKPLEWIIEQADYVTEMVKIKHPYDQGVKARKGIEF